MGKIREHSVPLCGIGLPLLLALLFQFIHTPRNEPRVDHYPCSERSQYNRKDSQKQQKNLRSAENTQNSSLSSSEKRDIYEAKNILKPQAVRSGFHLRCSRRNRQKYPPHSAQHNYLK